MIEIRQTVNSNLMTYRGSSQEDKPMTCAPGSTFYEWDTASGYMFDGEEWLLQTSGGGGGGVSFGNPVPYMLCPFVSGQPDFDNMESTCLVLFASAADFAAMKVLAGDLVTEPGDEGTYLASGMFVVVNPTTTISSSGTIGLYDVTEGDVTEIPDALTIEESGGVVEYFTFTVPELAEGHYVVIGYEGGAD